MTMTVVINDFQKDRRSLVVFSEHDFERTEKFWNNEDKLLVDLQSNSFFAGRRRWCDLSPTHFRVLVMRNLCMAADLPEDEARNPDNPVVRSLNFLLTALIRCLEIRSECSIELLRVNRINDTDVSFDYSGSLNMAVDIPKPSSGLRIIVDNT